jgi:ACS family pantothenate transporter-like MFS transporter
MPSVIRRIQQNKIGAVVVSVFDWYREYIQPSLYAELMHAASHYPAEERKLLRKLDLAILVFGCLSCKSKVRLLH